MKCDKCGSRPATYHSIKKVNGISTERHLCEECHFAEMDASDAFIKDIGNLFSGFKTFFEPSLPRRTLTCSNCGTTADEFLSTGFVGCEHCYSELKTAIMPVIEKTQKGTVHTGSRPAGQSAVSDLESEYYKLSAELKKAVAEEDYEKASKLQERLRKMKEGR